MDSIIDKVWNYEEIRREMKMRVLEQIKYNYNLEKVDNLPILVDHRVFMPWWAVFREMRKRK